MYQVGDKVAHPGHGGCIIQGVCYKEIRGETRRYYQLVPCTEPNTTILDPVENVRMIGLRDIISAEQANNILDSFPDLEASWIKDHTTRRQEYDKRIKSGDLTEIAKVIKELILRVQDTALTNCDKEMLSRAQKKLVSELALAKDIGYDVALKRVEQAVSVCFS